MTIEEKRRELFEAHYADINLDRSEHRPEFYTNLPTRMCWEAFNAALDAVVIELPKLWISNESGASEQAACQTLNACKQAIESTGLGLKVKS